jgi:hypothetical protein
MLSVLQPKLSYPNVSEFAFGTGHEIRPEEVDSPSTPKEDYPSGRAQTHSILPVRQPEKRMRKTAPQLVDINGREKREPVREAQEKGYIPDGINRISGCQTETSQPAPIIVFYYEAACHTAANRSSNPAYDSVRF